MSQPENTASPDEQPSEKAPEEGVTRSAFEIFGVQLDVNLPSEEEHKDLKEGDLCPQCGQAKLEYDGTLTLRCPNCGYGAGGCFT
jgi:rubredoxin